VATRLLLAVLSLLAAGGCIVTDRIEFTDAVNHPPEVIDVEPPNDSIGLVCPELQEFTVDLWDPDAGDLAYYGALIHAAWAAGTSEDWNYIGQCDPPTEITDPTDGAAGYGTGVFLRITCELPLDLFSISQSDPRLLVLVRVSDLGFFQGQVRDGARTAEVVWALDLLPDEGCE
jgi:hypothetical protein